MRRHFGCGAASSGIRRSSIVDPCPRRKPMSNALARIAPLITASLLWVGCSQEPPPPPPEDPCPHIGLDTLEGDWIKVQGSKADHRSRFRITGTPGDYDAVLVAGFWTKLEMEGSKRDTDYVFEEVLSGKALDEFRTGYRTKYRMYVEPYKKTCSLRTVIATVEIKEDGKEKEKPRTPGFEEFLQDPKQVEFTYQKPDGFLFLQEAASNRSVAEAQLKEFEGYPKPETQLGETIPVGVFTQAGADGPDSCRYTFDLYFDDKPYTGRRDSPSEAAGKNLSAGAVKDGYRHWFVPAWYAPYGGNHHFEMYRYKSCGGERELIGINDLEAVLH
jgi:hypothetical protein